MINKIYKNKYLIFNEDKKVLFFSKQIEDKIKYFLPTVYCGKNVISNQITPEVIKILDINIEDAQLIDDYHDRYFKYKKIEGENKLNKKIIREKKYYAIYHEFTIEEYEKIYNLCLSQDIMPYMIDFKELKHLINLNRKNEVDIDLGLSYTNRILKRKLNYKEY